VPKLSFVLPTYNRIAWLAECIESLRNQTEKDIEIVVVDDASTDRTRELMSWYTEQDRRIRYVLNMKNQGAGLSRNLGNNYTTASIIAVCDSDDTYSPDRAELILKAFEDKKIQLLQTSYYRVDYSGQIEDNGNYLAQEFIPKDFLEGKPIYFCHPSVAYRRKDALKVPYKKETKTETDDHMFLTDWIKSGRTVSKIKDFTLFHRVLPNSIMTNMRNGSLE
jgi:glycosyltransferase involved in cell wall biosynthesis